MSDLVGLRWQLELHNTFKHFVTTLYIIPFHSNMLNYNAICVTVFLKNHSCPSISHNCTLQASLMLLCVKQLPYWK